MLRRRIAHYNRPAATSDVDKLRVHGMFNRRRSIHVPCHSWYRADSHLLIALLCLLTFGSYGDVAPAQGRVGRVLVVANSNEPSSLELANYYAQKHFLPPANRLSLPFDTIVSLNNSAFSEQLLAPIYARLTELSTNVDYVVLIRGVPYRVGKVSVTSAVMFGGIERMSADHAFYRRSIPFESSLPLRSQRLYPTTFISAYNVDDGLKLIDSSLVHYPEPAQSGRIYFCDGKGPRGARNVQIQPSMEMLSRLGMPCEHVKRSSLTGRNDVLAQFTGATSIELDGNRYLPGSIVDNLTSYGGKLLEKTSQNSALDFVRHGVSGAYGTVSEPTNQLTRWSNYSLPLLYVSGYSLIECYLQTVQDWKFGVVVGDPLMAPFRKHGRIEIGVADTTSATVDALDLSIAGINPGYTIAWAEAWLNNRIKIFDFEPTFNARADWQLSLNNGDDVVFSRSYQSAPGERVSRVLDFFSYCSTEDLVLRPVGKRLNRLLVQWKPSVAKVVNSDVFCTLVAVGDGIPYVQRRKLSPEPLRLDCAVFDFGPHPPQKGDRVVLKSDRSKRRITATGGQSMGDFMEQIRSEMTDFMEQKGHTSDWNVDIRPPIGDGDPEQLWLVPRGSGRANRPPITIRVVQSKGSVFARDFENQEVWRSVHTSSIAEAVLQPALPCSGLEERISIDPAILTRGMNRLHVTAGTPMGSIAEADVTFNVPETEYSGNVVAAESIVSLRDSADFAIDYSPALRAATPELFLDGIPVAMGRAGSHSFRLAVSPTLISPGKHEVWVEWQSAANRVRATTPAPPLYRSESIDLFVRRPVTMDASFDPQEVVAGPNAQVRIKGVYLHDALRFVINGKVAKHRRDPNNGQIWHVSLAGINPGTYLVSVFGLSKHEDYGSLRGRLSIRDSL